MLTLNDGRNELWQWDTGRKLTVDAECSQVHFSNKVFGRSIDVDVVDGIAIIPDILLQTDKDLTAWAFVGTAENGYTKISNVFKVNKRNKPADYVFTPPEQTSLEELIERLDKIEEEQIPDAVKNAVEDYLEKKPVDVQSVNGKTGAVQLSASDVGARPDNWMPTAQEVGALPSTYTPPNQTAEQVGADPKGAAASAVSQHNTAEDSHGDIRLELKAINDRLTAFFDSDDQTLDELSEIVSYITNNKTLIESITTSKVSVADIVNNLTTNVSNKPLSAAQGVALKGLIDTLSNSLNNYQTKGDYALRSELPTVPTNVSAFTNDAGYLTEHQDVSGKLDADKLPEAVNDALAQAKASGEFDGNNGKDGVSATHSWNGTTLEITSASGTSSANLKGDKGEKGDTGVVDYSRLEEYALLEDVRLSSTGDTTDRLAEIQALLDNNGYVKLGKGEFYLSGQLRIKNGATLDGCGKSTVIKQTPDSTQPSMIYLQSEGTIRNVCIQGEWTETPTNDTPKSSTRIGIVITNGTNNAIIDGCWIWGWTGQGILATTNSTATRSFLMSNCDVCFNNIGLKTAESEYACITNCTFRNNITGVLNNGGNNKFVSCGFDVNYDGFVINEGYNNGHGSCNGCTFNHNTHYAVNMAYTELGFVFSGCNFAEGTIRNTKSKGIMFSGCRFGNWLKYNNYTENVTLFSGCIFSHSPQTESSEWLDTYGGYKFTGCFNYNTGESVDNIPVSASETWTFTLEDGSVAEREVLLND